MAGTSEAGRRILRYCGSGRLVPADYGNLIGPLFLRRLPMMHGVNPPGGNWSPDQATVLKMKLTVDASQKGRSDASRCTTLVPVPWSGCSWFSCPRMAQPLALRGLQDCSHSCTDCYRSRAIT